MTVQGSGFKRNTTSSIDPPTKPSATPSPAHSPTPTNTTPNSSDKKPETLTPGATPRITTIGKEISKPNKEPSKSKTTKPIYSLIIHIIFRENYSPKPIPADYKSATTGPTATFNNKPSAKTGSTIPTTTMDNSFEPPTTLA